MIDSDSYWDILQKIGAIASIIALIAAIIISKERGMILISFLIVVVFIFRKKIIDRCKKSSVIPHFKMITALIILLFLLNLPCPNEDSEFDITLDEILQRFQSESIFIISQEEETWDLLGIIDMYWAWGISGFNRPEHSLDLNPKDDFTNLIYLISREDKEGLEDILKKIGIWHKYKKYGLEEKDISSFVFFSELSSKNYLWIVEKEFGGLNAATLYLSNPANWLFHSEDSFLFFSWQDSNKDGLIQIHEIIVEPKKNQMIGFRSKSRKEENSLMQEFRESPVISLGTEFDDSDLMSAANITWSLGNFLSDPEKPKILVSKIEEVDVINVIIIGGTYVNVNAKETCDRLGIRAFYEEGKNWKITIEPGAFEMPVEDFSIGDLCVVASEKVTEGNRILIAGIGENGTLAGSIFLSKMENWKYFDHYNILILAWQDANSDSIVQLNEIVLKYKVDAETSQKKIKLNGSIIGRV